MHYAYEETHTVDERCYTHFALNPEILMEHAGLALANAVKKSLHVKKVPFLSVALAIMVRMEWWPHVFYTDRKSVV